MHDIKSIRDDPKAFDAALTRRGLAPVASSLLAIDEKRRAAILASEQAQARRNAASKEIGDAKKAKDEARAAKLMAEVTELKTTMPQLEQAAKAADEELARELAAIPNLPLPAPEVPDGIDEHGNVQRHVFGKPRDYGFAPQPHDDLGTALGFMDFETAAKLSGARFVVLKKGLARLERAIGQFMLDLHIGEHGYAEINPPLLVRNEVMFGTGQLPKFEDDQFWAIKGELLVAPDDGRLKSERLGLIPTAEVSLTTPETSKDEHERMLSCAEEVLRRLDLHYRVMTLCAGDMGFSAQKTYDIEVWMPGQGEGGAFREISSCSVCGDFQARRMDARYRGPDGKPRFVHTLNGSGTAVGRALIAVMETYQQEDGSIAVPDVLQPYMGGLKVIEKGR